MANETEHKLIIDPNGRVLNCPCGWSSSRRDALKFTKEEASKLFADHLPAEMRKPRRAR